MRQALPTLVRDLLAELGFNWRAVEGVPDPHYWPRPPLFTTASLSGHALMPHLALPTSRDPDELVDTYERFISGAIYRQKYHEIDIPAWFARACGMRLAPARMLFVPPAFCQLRLRLHLNLVQFAALVAYNHECYIEEGPDHFVVTTAREAYRFGIEDGRAVTNMDRRPTKRTSGLVSPTGKLSDIARGTPALPHVSSRFDATADFVDSQRERLGSEYGPLKLALQTLWWRHEGVYPSRLLNMTYKETSVAALRAALAEARDFDNYEHPLRALQQIFVPQFLSHGRFRKMFGDPYAKINREHPSQLLRHKWLAAINELEPDPQEG